jgi:carboxylate-amine ligase
VDLAEQFFRPRRADREKESAGEKGGKEVRHQESGCQRPKAAVVFYHGVHPMRPSFTIGIEEEYQTVDPETRDLRSHIHTEILPQGRLRMEERVKAEMHQSVVEVGTRVCTSLRDAKEDLFDLRRQMIGLAQENGLVLVAGATHPFADWRVQEIYPDDRYKQVVEDLQLVARANLIFGLHVHVGIEDRETAIRIMNSLRYFLPHILALSTNSPFWMGMNTGLKSYRAKVFDKFPRTNLPDSFSSWSEFESFVNLLIRTNSIDNAKKIWWDVRPHPFFATVEVRICDLPMRTEETLALAALIQATAAKLWQLQENNQDYRQYSRALLMENKWRAVRYGLDGKLIDFGKQQEVPERELILEYLEFIDDVVDDLDCREGIDYIHTILRDGTGADRQLKKFAETNDLKAVVDYMAEETRTGLF